MPRLRKWYTTYRSLGFFQDPSLFPPCLCGEIYGDKRFEDGRNVITSCVKKVIEKAGYKEVITKSGTHYQIYPEDVLPEYEEKYPNAYERLQIVE